MQAGSDEKTTPEKEEPLAMNKMRERSDHQPLRRAGS
jgi:hypothetical protein